MAVARIPEKLFSKIEKIMPISSVDIVILKEDRIILTKRTIRPYRGYWHLPGSVILKNEKATDTVERCAKDELGIKINDLEFIDYYELFGDRHYISHLFVTYYLSGKLELDYQSSAVKLVRPEQIPSHTIPQHKLMIKDALMRMPKRYK